MSQNETIIKIKTFCALLLASPTRFADLLRRNLQILLNKIDSSKRKEPCIFLIGTPEYGNLGDQIIAVAELRFLHDFYPDYKVREFTHEKLLKDKNCRLLLSQINKNDLIFLQGGGNLNDIYLNCERIRRTVVSKCPDNKIVLFQQSISFSDTEKGNAVKAETCRVYNNHKNFTIIAREEKSYAVAKEIFPQLDVIKYPDMATYLFGKLPISDKKRAGVLICIRDDMEKFYSDSQVALMLDVLKNENNLDFTDTNIHRVVTPEKRLEEITALLNKFSCHKVVVTDRFHGVILSILSGTPCVVLRSTDHKIVDGVKWFKDYNGVYYADNIADVPALVEKAKSPDNFKIPDFTHYFEEMHKKLNI